METVDVPILVERLQSLLPTGLTAQKRMFGGITFMLAGNMLMCASKKGLMVRVGAAAEPDVLKSPHASPCTGTGRPMAGFVMIAADGLRTEAELSHWIGLARTYVETLPAKPEKASK
jgi:hypothetical protein